MGRKYQSIIETVGNTPVVRINRLAPQGVNLFVKIEAFNPLGSVKDRLALGVIEAAERSGEVKPGQTVIEAGFDQIEQVWMFAKASSNGSVLATLGREVERAFPAIARLAIENRRIDLGGGAIGF